MMGKMALGATWLVVSVGLLLRGIAGLTGLHLGALYLPAMFMNSGNMMLPLTLFAFGESGLRYGHSFDADCPGTTSSQRTDLELAATHARDGRQARRWIRDGISFCHRFTT